MSNRETMQQALECIERCNAHGWILADYEDEVYAAIAALKAALAQEHALHELARLGQEIEQEPSQWRDMVVVSLVREGIDKHRSRELADHFAAQPEPPPEWEAINNIIAEYGLQAIDFVSDWKAAQRPWVGLTVQEVGEIADKEGNGYILEKQLQFYADVWAKLKERNHG